jgi:hypothetical protein
MKTTCRLCALLLMVGPVASVPLLAADDIYDLRGPAPKKGQKFVDRTVTTMKKADITVKIGGIELEGKMDSVHTSEEEVEFLAVDGRNVTKQRTRIIKDEDKRKINLGGDEEDETQKGELVGEIVFSELTKDGWKHSLEDTKPSEKQLKELKSFSEPISDDELYPEQKIKVGHEWEITPEAMKKVLGTKVIKIAGKGKSKFLRIEKVGNEDCAVIETNLEFKATVKERDNDIDVEFKGKIISHRSLKLCIDVKSFQEGMAKYAGIIEEDGMKVDLKVSGKETTESKTEVKKP